MISLPLTRTALNAFLCILACFLIIPTSCLAGQFKVTRVYDGDTLRAEGYGTAIKVRLAGIDAPEIDEQNRERGQEFGQEAKEYLEALVLNRTVEIQGHGRRRHNLVLGTVFLEDKIINLEMIRAGFAEVYHGKRPPDLDLEPYVIAEREAAAAKKGMWVQGEKYVSPWEWRKNEKVKSACAIILYGICNQKEW